MTLLASMLASALRGARRPAKGWAVLTPKLGPVGFYKGRGVPATGRHTRKGVCVREREWWWAEGCAREDANRRGGTQLPAASTSPFFHLLLLHHQAPTKSCPKNGPSTWCPT